MLDLETHLKFDPKIKTEPRFKFRNWLEKWCANFAKQENKNAWGKGFSQKIKITGLTENPLNKTEFIQFVERQHKLGGWEIRISGGNVKLKSAASWQINADIECYTAGLLSCAGTLQAEINTLQNKFYFCDFTIVPRFRVAA